MTHSFGLPLLADTEPRRGASLGQLLPLSVRVRELRGEVASSAYPILPAEEPLVAAAVASRRAQFAAVRHCAREALAKLGRPGGPLLSDPRGAPVWPEGVIGSMTHTHEYCAAAVTADSRFASVGIDAESHAPLPEGVLSIVARGEERERLALLTARDPSVSWDRVLFSVKESVYKAWYPLTRRWLGFEEVSVRVEPVGRRLTARLLTDGLVVAGFPLRELTGRFAVDEGVVLTAVTIPALP
jgi:4'-phosphopantetheinyl transferase EntD